MGVTIHGLTKTPIYRVWKNMRKRCLRPNSKDYVSYGGRGITICDRWLKFANFYADMGDVPFQGAQLDRIDNNGNYEPSNCRWVTAKVNARNRRQTRMWTFGGKTMCMKDWAAYLGLEYHVIRHRVNQRGWSIEKALSTPFIDRKHIRTWQTMSEYERNAA